MFSPVFPAALRPVFDPGGAPAEWSPLDLASLYAWYDASQLTGLSAGAAVSTWPDVSGNGRDMTEERAGCTYETNEVNGLPAVRDNFTGLLRAVLFTPLDATIALVYKASPIHANNRPTGFGSHRYNAATVPVFNLASDNSIRYNNGALTGSEPTTTAYHLRLSRKTGTAYYDRVNGAVNINASRAGVVTHADFFFGSLQETGRDVWGAEIVVTNAALSLTDIDLLEAYFADKYALTLA